jgi:antitoxin component YwqK of YwqJK toxin-antitoxin module
MNGRGAPMKSKYGLATLFVGLACAGCGPSGKDPNVVLSRYVHRYGYDVSREEWETQQHPGQVLTTLRNGQTISTSYEEGVLHGTKTQTFPHSQTIQVSEKYHKGSLVKRVTYSIRGVPQKEEVFKSPTEVLVTTWYPSGTPKTKEEFKDDVLLNGQYFNLANDIDSRVENGTGERTQRNQSGDLLSKEVFSNYTVTYLESYYPNNCPHTTTSYENGLIHGEKKVFAMSGEPLSVENYLRGEKHGPATYYQNGYKYLEVNYDRNLKDGLERHFVDGDIVIEETEYKNGLKHGSSIVFCDGSARTTWYFEDAKVPKPKYEELTLRSQAIMSMQPEN